MRHATTGDALPIRIAAPIGLDCGVFFRKLMPTGTVGPIPKVVVKTTLLKGFLDVLLLGSDIQMCWVYTWWVVAPMADIEITRRRLPVMKLP